MSAMSEPEISSPYWLEGNAAGSDDATNALDHQDAIRTGDAFALSRGKPSRTRNPHPPGTYEHNEWGNGYEHGRRDTTDHYRRTP